MLFDIAKIKNTFPFISEIRSNNDIYHGIILNYDKLSISFIDIGKIRDKKEFVALINLSERWWWYSNRSIPLNLFYSNETELFMKYVTHLPAKTSDVVSGHVASLQTILDATKTNKKNRTLNVY